MGTSGKLEKYSSFPWLVSQRVKVFFRFGGLTVRRLYGYYYSYNPNKKTV